ncbi:peroxidasin-like [Montipora foliosa]|uniref:peroxidasin-like n=1 Tax=Montipora foliosa TaxID=591990 RepID=UPI0035F21004
MKATSFLLAVVFMFGVHEMRHSMVSSIHGEDLIETFHLHGCEKLSTRLSCAQIKYRTIDGTCNNLCNTTVGASFTELARLLPADYQNSVLFTPRSKSVALHNPPLPNPRAVRIATLPSTLDENADGVDPPFTILTMHWGQFIDHDIALTEMIQADCGNNRDPCPVRPKECLSVSISPLNLRLKFDPEFLCIPLRRSAQTKDGEQINIITHYVDGSMVYGSDAMALKNLRTFKSGQMLTDENELNYGRDEFLPPNPETFCLPNGTGNECFLGGDIRVNENHALAAMHTLWVREHNRIARQLELINEHWDDEKLFQEARRIVVAEIQHIHYNEWLPTFYNESVREREGILLEPKGRFFEDYDPELDPSLINSFATAAYRMGHSLVREEIFLVDPLFRKRGFSEPGSFIPLAEFYNPNQFFSEGNNVIAGIIAASMVFPGRQVDHFITETITDNLTLEGEGGDESGTFDLPTLNIARGRGHGLPGYAAFLRAFDPTVPKPASFSDLKNIPLDRRHVLQGTYRSAEDIDLFPGGLNEERAPGSQMGDTFTRLITKQFFLFRHGDRFWYEREHQFGFSLPQLDSIRDVTFAKVACLNLENVVFTPAEAFKVSKVAVNCDSLLGVDLSLFKEEAETGEEEPPAEPAEPVAMA